MSLSWRRVDHRVRKIGASVRRQRVRGASANESLTSADGVAKSSACVQCPLDSKARMHITVYQI